MSADSDPETTSVEGPESAPNDQRWRARLTAAADDVEAKTEAARLARELRDDLIVEACDHAGHSHTDVARWARVSRARITEILGQH